MSPSFNIDFIWIPASLGGHSNPPYDGMRPQIRWQRHLREHFELSRDVSCDEIVFEQATSIGSLRATMSSEAPVPEDWLRDGNLIELVNGFSVLAVGRIRERR